MKKFWKYFGRICVSIGTVLLLAVVFVVGAILVVSFGPSETASNLFINSAMESSVGRIIVPMILGEEEAEKIAAENQVEQTTEITDTDLIVIPEKTDNTENTENTDEEIVEPIELIPVTEETYNGYVVLIHDPSRVSVGVSGPFGPGYSGKTVEAMAESAGALLAVNGGGFDDPGGRGNGGTPLGIVIQDGRLAWGTPEEEYEVIGFDKDNKMVLGVMTGQEALDRGIQSALSFGPFLIVNGEPTEVTGSGGGLNPRTVIGQRADGTIIIAVIDGRQPNSLGGTMSDMVALMTKFEAVNAANLDGGSSSVLYYEGEYINHPTSLYGPRRMPTCIIVK